MVLRRGWGEVQVVWGVVGVWWGMAMWGMVNHDWGALHIDLPSIEPR